VVGCYLSVALCAGVAGSSDVVDCSPFAGTFSPFAVGYSPFHADSVAVDSLAFVD